MQEGLKNPKLLPLLVSHNWELGEDFMRQQAEKFLHAAKAGLKGFETCSDIYLTTTEFSPDNGLLTPTFKIKRTVAARVFQREIAQMYAKK